MAKSSSPFSIPGPLYDFMELRFALSNDDLKTKFIPSFSVIAFSFSAVVKSISLLSIAQGPAIMVNFSPPISKLFNLTFVTLKTPPDVL